MSRVRIFLKYWLPVVLWMGLIFGASADTGSSQRSSRLIEPFVRWLFPDVSEPVVDAAVFYVRKCAHVAEYGVLALLLWRAIRKPSGGAAQPWRWPQVALVLGISFLYAASDEFHQSRVPNREGRFHDVAIDTFGAALALGALWAFGKCRQRWRHPGRESAPRTKAPVESANR